MVFAQFLYRVNPHYETVHPDYVAWLGPYRRNLYAISTSLIIIFGVTGLLSLSQGGVYIYISWIAGLLFAVFGVYETWNLQRTLKQYAQAWNEKKGASLPN